MEEVVNEIMEMVRQKAAPFSYMDQAQIYEELASRMSDLNLDALHREYAGDEYLLDGV